MTKFLKAMTALGLLAGAGLLAAGALAHWYPRFDILNNGLPVLFVGALALLALAFALRARKLIGAAAALLAITLAILLLGLQGRAADAPPDAERFLRVVTFNMWVRNDHHLERIGDFLKETDADAVVLQEVRGAHAAFIDSLGSLYPHRVGDNGLFILSKHPIIDEGQTDRPDQPPWMSRIIRWARLDVNGKPVTLAGVHLARPFYSALQLRDIGALTRFVKEQSGPLILAGDFNMTPWTVKMRAFAGETGLGYFDAFHPTWPMRLDKVPLLPFVSIDNVFASNHFAKIATTVGPRLDSDHRAVIADIALIE